MYIYNLFFCSAFFFLLKIDGRGGRLIITSRMELISFAI